ncbi:MAG: CvpA family protein [Bacteroidia bacterium]|nr:CvpA family protein [Bacteroidia bacterium]
MNVVDIVLVVLLVGAAVNGFTKGFFVELASIASLILGIWAAVEFSGLVQHWLSRYLTWSNDSMRLVSFILVFVFVVILVHLIATLTEKFVEAIALNIFSRLAGAIFGALKAAFILSILMIIISKIEDFTITIIPEKAKVESRFYGPIENMAPNIFPFLKAEKEKMPEKSPKNPST